MAKVEYVDGTAAVNFKCLACHCNGTIPATHVTVRGVLKDSYSYRACLECYTKIGPLALLGPGEERDRHRFKPESDERKDMTCARCGSRKDVAFTPRAESWLCFVCWWNLLGSDAYGLMDLAYEISTRKEGEQCHPSSQR